MTRKSKGAPRGPLYWIKGLWVGCVHCGSRWPHRAKWCDEAEWLCSIPLTAEEREKEWRDA